MRFLLIFGLLSLAASLAAAFLHETRRNPLRAIFNLLATLIHVHAVDGEPTPRYIVWLFSAGALALAAAFLLMHFQ